MLKKRFKMAAWLLAVVLSGGFTGPGDKQKIALGDRRKFSPTSS